MMRLFFLVMSFSSLMAMAEERPSCNPTEEDSALFHQQSARDFFAARTSQDACVAKLADAKAKFVAARDAVVKLVTEKASASAIDAKENELDALRVPYVDALAECGMCATHPIGDPVEIQSGGRTEIWYKSDGSCQLPISDKAELTAAFDRLTNDLTHLSKYPRQPKTQQGFNSIFTVQAYEPATGVLKPEVDTFDGAGTNLFLSVKGPNGTAFSYYFFDKFSTEEKQAGRVFNMRGEAVEPKGFTPPRQISYTTASGKKKNALNSMLGEGSQTTWYITEDGYIRYCATADFGVKSAFVQNFGRTQMLDLLSTATEKALAK